jgi:hypothetical protein
LWERGDHYRKPGDDLWECRNIHGRNVGLLCHGNVFINIHVGTLGVLTAGAAGGH